METEIWRDIYINYSVSNTWKVLNKLTWSIYSAWTDYFWYQIVIIKVLWKRRTFRVHRLVAMAFLPNPNNYPVIMHLDNKTNNNNVSNLKWWTQKENLQQSISLKKHCSMINKWKFWCLHPTSKIVFQYSKDSNLIKKWESITNASDELWISSSNISQCLKWRLKTAGGFIWKYNNI